MAQLVRVLKGAKLGEPLQRDPVNGDFPHLGISVRQLGDPRKVVVFNIAANVLRIGDRMLYPTQRAVVDVGVDLIIDDATFRVIA